MTPADRSSTITAMAIAAIAYALADMVHEALGHGLVSLVVPGVKALSISTVALSAVGSSRLVAASGMVANVVVGSLMLWLFATRRQFTPGSYFLWIFGAVNLMNVGYLAYSGVLRSGDWFGVIADLPMQRAWQIGLIAGGVAGYMAVLRLLAATMALQIRRFSLDGRDVRRVIIVSYFAGSALIVLGAVMNPIESLILLSGVAVGFAGTCGLVPVAGWIEPTTADGATRAAVRFSGLWILCGVVVAAAFVLILGPGVQLQR